MRVKLYHTIRLILFSSVICLNFHTAAFAEDYKLGPQDRLEIKVYDLRSGSGEAHQWSAFDGQIIVDSNGDISLPIIGSMKVDNLTVGDLSKDLSTKMQSKVGLAEPPTVAVQVVKYRPFYIAGDVEKPGEYEYRPGLTVIQAISVAGGLYRLLDNGQAAMEKEIISQRGDVSVRVRERIALIAKAARLEAEIKGAISVSFPAEMSAKASSSELEKITSYEADLFKSRRNTLESQLKNISDTKKALSQELESLTKKSLSLDRQYELIQEDLNTAQGLVSKGLAISTRQLAAEQNRTSAENSRLDVQVAKFRASQDISRLDREAIELPSKFKQDAINELLAVRNKISELGQRDETSKLLIKNATRAGSFRAESSNLSYMIFRVLPGRTVELEAMKSDPIKPGDVLTVRSTERGEGVAETTNVDISGKFR